MFNAQVTWGDELSLVTRKYKGGLKAAVTSLHRKLGLLAPSRGTFQQLLKVDDPSELDAVAAYRAYLLLTELGEPVSRWRLPEFEMPAVFDRNAFEQLCAARDLNPQPADSSVDTKIARRAGIHRQAKPAIVPRIAA